STAAHAVGHNIQGTSNACLPPPFDPAPARESGPPPVPQRPSGFGSRTPMANEECLLTNEIRSPNDDKLTLAFWRFELRHSDFCRISSFVIRHLPPTLA